MIHKRVRYIILMTGEPEAMYKVRHDDDFLGAMADADRRGEIEVTIESIKEIN